MSTEGSAGMEITTPVPGGDQGTLGPALCWCCLWPLLAQLDSVTFRDTARSQGVTFGAKKEGPVPGKLQAAEFPHVICCFHFPRITRQGGSHDASIRFFDSSDPQPCCSCKFTSASLSGFPPQGQGGHFQQAWNKPKCASC